MNRKFLTALLKSILVVMVIVCSIKGTSQSKIAGLTMVGPPNPFEQDPMLEMKKTNSNWITFVPYAFVSRSSPELKYESNRQWWGERIAGVEQSIILAKKNGFKIMIKPQVWVSGSWIGELDFDTKKEWQIWEEAYKKYIMSFVNLAKEYDVEMICIGTEIKKSVQKREGFWRALIKDIRQEYSGKLTYSSNWDNYGGIPFWDDLDYIGISSYFPLTDAPTPSVSFLKYKWTKVMNKLEKFSVKHEKQILFTEYGYLSVDGCADKTWILEKKRRELNANEKAQANALEALYTSLWPQSWWAGGFLWKWYPNGKAQEGRREKDYTPQGKVALEVIAKWYGKANATP